MNSLGFLNEGETVKMLNENKEEKFERKTHLGEMSDEERTIFKELIREYEDIFEYDEEKLGKVGTVKHEIVIEENQGPIAQKRYKEIDQKCSGQHLFANGNAAGSIG